MSLRKLITILTPVYDEEASLPIFFSRLQAALAEWRDRYDFELIFTNNRSEDRTLEILRELRQQDSSVQFLTFSRNFGYHASLLAGLRFASGDAIVMIDVDCEDPPEMVPKLLAEWEKGYQIVYGRRDKRAEPTWIHIGKKIFYRVNRLVADSEIVLDMGEFMLMTARVRDTMLDNQSTFPYVRTEVAYVGFDRQAIPMSRAPRVGGRSHYNIFGMVKMALGAILSASTMPLRMAAYLAGPLLLVNTWYLLSQLGEANSGLRIMMTLDMMYLIAFMSFVCLYAARIYKNVVNRPLYVVDWRLSELNGSIGPDGAEPPPSRVWGAQLRARRLARDAEPRP